MMYKLTFFKLLLCFSAFGLFVSCSKNKDSVEIKTYSNLDANGGEYIKFSFAQNEIVTDKSWDIAFSVGTIIVNGGTKAFLSDGHNEPERTGNGAVSIISNTSLEAVKSVPEDSTFNQDSTNTYAIPIIGHNRWYNYDSETYLVTPVAGRVFVVKTHDGKYAKLEFISVYKNAPAMPSSTSPIGYYTFRFVYQANGTNF